MAYLFETDEHAALRAQIRRFAEREIAPHAHAWDEAKEFPRELYRQGRRRGPPRRRLSRGARRRRRRHQPRLVACEELVLAGKSVGVKVGLGSHGIALPPILALGTDEQKRALRAAGPRRREDRGARHHRAGRRLRRRRHHHARGARRRPLRPRRRQDLHHLGLPRRSRHASPCAPAGPATAASR